MKVEDTKQPMINVQYLQQSRQAAQARPSASGDEAPHPSRDQVDISVQSREMKKIHDAQVAAPETRKAKVEELKRLIESGRYQPRADAVAEKMIRDSLWDLLGQ